MHTSPAALLLSAAVTLLSSAAHAESVLHEIAPVQLPSGWKYLGPADKSTRLSLSIALKQPGIQELRARVDDISNPLHEDYGAHLTRDALSAYREVPEAAVQAVVSWLKEEDVTDIGVEDAWIRFNATVSQADNLLNCAISRYQVAETTVELYRATQYSLPEELLDSIDYVYPVTQFMLNTKAKMSQRANLLKSRSDASALQSRAEMPVACQSSPSIDPTCIAALYNITYYPQDELSNSSLGIAGFLEEYPGLDYIHEFLATYSPRRNTSGFTSDYNFTVVSVNGGSTENMGKGGEANLDVSLTMPFVQPLDVIYYSTGGRGPFIDGDGVSQNATVSSNEPYVEFLEDLVSRDSIPQVLSISYADDEQSVALPYATRVCDLFMQLGARGVSVLIASGDGGEGGVGESAGCYANDGFGNKTMFIPTFPAGCPYVTSVGATTAYSPIAGASLSGGGFSNYFARPSWQDAAATGYISALNGSHAGWYNASGRGIPDIAAVGSRIAMVGGHTTKGTSASTPIVASMIALINDKRLRAGKPVLGFLNPLLYSGKVDEALLDCTEGSGGSCYFGHNQVKLGFDALPGWDPVTGLGTMNLGKALELLS